MSGWLSNNINHEYPIFRYQCYLWLVARTYIITAICLYMMMRPLNTYDGAIGFMGEAFEFLFRLFWLLPVLVAWLIYFIIF